MLSFMTTRAVAAAKTKDSVKTVSTPWGSASIVDEVTLGQRVGERRFASVVQLLETASGERLVRFAYTTSGTARRGPVTLRERDLERLRAALDQHPTLKEALMA
jgi:hypothetical protein